MDSFLLRALVGEAQIVLLLNLKEGFVGEMSEPRYKFLSDFQSLSCFPSSKQEIQLLGKHSEIFVSAKIAIMFPQMHAHNCIQGSVAEVV